MVNGRATMSTIQQAQARNPASLRQTTVNPGNQTIASSFPLLQQLLAEKAIAAKGIYTVTHAAQIFGVGTTQDWIRAGKLHSHDLPGRRSFPVHTLRKRSKNQRRVAARQM
jgi:hypothetical protein